MHHERPELIRVFEKGLPEEGNGRRLHILWQCDRDLELSVRPDHIEIYRWWRSLDRERGIACDSAERERPNDITVQQQIAVDSPHPLPHPSLVLQGSGYAGAIK